MKIDVMTDVLAANDRIAAANREIFDQNGVLVINLMSSPALARPLFLRGLPRPLQGRCDSES